MIKKYVLTSCVNKITDIPYKDKNFFYTSDIIESSHFYFLMKFYIKKYGYKDKLNKSVVLHKIDSDIESYILELCSLLIEIFISIPIYLIKKR